MIFSSRINSSSGASSWRLLTARPYLAISRISDAGKNRTSLDAGCVQNHPSIFRLFGFTKGRTAVPIAAASCKPIIGILSSVEDSFSIKHTIANISNSLKLAIHKTRHIIKNMKKLLYGLCLLLCIPVAHVNATPNSMLITEIQTESALSATEEYITIANNSSQEIDITGWRLAYVTATAATLESPSRTIPLSGLVGPSETASATTATVIGKQDARWTFASTLSASGGHVLLQKKLVSGMYETVDIVGWGSALHAESAPAEAVSKGQVYARRTQDGVYVDTENNKEDFSVDVPVAIDAGSGNTVVAIEITELMPDPVAPLSDANDEYIELYNPTNQPALLSGLKLQTGTTYSYTYAFAAEVIPANSYLVLYASTTNVSLSNSGGKARIIDASGTTLNEVSAYGKAEAGKSWSLISGAWEWAEPSPMAEATIVAIAGTQTSTKTTGGTKSTKSSKSTTSKSASTGANKKEASTPFAAYSAPPQDGAIAPVNPLILAGVGVFAVGYMIYEYKNDILFRVKQRHRNRILRKAARSKA